MAVDYDGVKDDGRVVQMITYDANWDAVNKHRVENCIVSTNYVGYQYPTHVFLSYFILRFVVSNKMFLMIFCCCYIIIKFVVGNKMFLMIFCFFACVCFFEIYSIA